MTMLIKRGKTFNRVLRPTAPPYIYKAITAIAKSAPAQITATAHGLVAGQYVAVVSVKGMKEINAALDSKGHPRDDQYHKATVIDPNTIALNDVNAADFSAYTSGGYLQFLTPLSMAGATVRRAIKDRIGGTELLRLDNGANGGLAIDDVNHTITETISATVTAALAWKKGVTDLELEIGGVVTEIDSEDVVVVQAEVTT